MPNTIYRNWNSGLGDTWATIQLLAQLRCPAPVFLSTIQHGENLRGMQQAIIDAMDHDYFYNSIVLVDEEPNTDLDGYAVWAALPIPTKDRWECSSFSKTVTMQFDGVSTPELKNPSPEEIVRITHWVLSHGFEPRLVGKNRGLLASIWAMKTSVLFIGCDSGMSHVASSVGVPTYILEKQLPIVTCHRHRAYVKCENVEHFFSQAENYLTFLRFINQGNP